MFTLELRRVSLAVLILEILLSGSCGFSSSKETYLERGNRLTAEGKYDDAVLQYRKAIQKDSKYGEAYLHFAAVLIKLNKNEEAYNAFTQAADLMPGSEEAQSALGRNALSILLKTPQRPRVLYQTVDRVSQKLLEGNQNSFEGLRLRGLLAMVDSNSGQAIDHFQKALRTRPNDPEITTVLVQNLLIEKRDSEAEQLALKSLTAIKNYGALYDTLYSIYMRSGRVAAAEQLLQSKIANNPTQAFYVMQLADHYQARKDSGEVGALLTGFLANEKLYPSAKLEAGDFHRRAGRLEEAAVLFQKGVDSDLVRRKEYLQRLAGVRMEQGRNREASQVLETILKESPSDGDAISSRASLRMATGKPEEMTKALEEFEILVQRKPDNEQARFLMARAYRALGQNGQARATLQALLKRNPDNHHALREMADIAIRAQRADEALQYAERLIAKDPNDISSQLVRTAAWALQRRFNDVRRELRLIHSRYRDLPEASLQLATLHIEEKNYLEAESILLRLYQPGKNAIPALRRLVNLYMVQGRPQKAIDLVREEAKRSESPEVRVLLATTAAQTGDGELALVTVQKLTADFPQNPDHWIARGEIYLQNGSWDQAITSFQRARQIAPTDPHSSALLGSALGQTGRYQEAVAAYRESLQLQPGDPLLMNNLAWYLVQSGPNFDEAILLAQKALQKTPGNSQYADTIGMIYLKAKKLDSALQTLQGVVSKEPSNPEFRRHMAMALLALNQTQKARTELEIALKNHPSTAEEREIRDLLDSMHKGG